MAKPPSTPNTATTFDGRRRASTASSTLTAAMTGKAAAKLNMP